MIQAYKEHIQFILLLIFMYVVGVWLDPVIYVVFPIVIVLLGLKQRFFELLICTLWILILSDYVPVRNATYADLQFAKDLKPIMPIALLIFYLLNRDIFKPLPKMIFYFIPFFITACISLNYSINFQVGLQKTISFILMYLMIPIYVLMLAIQYKEFFWRSFFTFIIGMLFIGIVLGFAVPEIGMLEGGRFKGIFGNPNGLGVFLNLVFILWIVIEEFNLCSFSRRERFIIMFVILFSLFWCGSRNAIMSVTLFYLVFRAAKINWFLALIIIASFVIFSDAIFNFFIELISFFGLESYFRVDSLEEGSGRQIAWGFVWSEIQNYFFIGGGFGHDENVMRPNYSWLKMQGHDGGVHNSYFSMWLDTGVIGMFFYYGALVRLYLSSFRFSYVVIAFAVSIFFNSTYESWMVASLNPFTIMFLLILTIFTEKISGENFTPELALNGKE